MDYRRGSKGDEVKRLQRRLQVLNCYAGPVDGDFGGGTEIAVRRFQQRAGLTVDGIVGPETWRALFPGEVIPRPALLQQPVGFRCLALTGAFETSSPPPGCFCCITSDFDGQGISFGALQFNFGQGTLAALLNDIDRREPALMEEIFGDRLPILREVLAGSRAEQLAFARSIQDPRRRLHEPWRGMFVTLGRTDACQQAQLRMAADYLERARSLCRRFGVVSDRALALMFDIAVQNGGIGRVVAARIDDDVDCLPASLDPVDAEVARMRIIANRRAEAATPRWVEDVRARKLCIANGEGRVHGAYYRLEADYGLSLSPLAPLRDS